MAIDQTDKAVSIAKRLVNLSEQIMSVIAESDALKNEKESSGVDLEAYNAVYEAGELRHVDGTRLNNCITSFAALKTWAESNFHDDIWQQARR